MNQPGKSAQEEANDRWAAAGALSPDGYKASISQLFRNHNQALVRFLRTRLPSEAEAKDVAQEAYVKLLQLAQPNTVSFLQGYLFRIAANLAVDRLRAQGTRDRAAAELFEELNEVEAIEHRAIRREEFDRILSALEELPAKCREAFILHVVEGHSQAEVAGLFRCTERSVRNYITRAVEHCRRKMPRDPVGGDGKDAA